MASEFEGHVKRQLDELADWKFAHASADGGVARYESGGPMRSSSNLRGRVLMAAAVVVAVLCGAATLALRSPQNANDLAVATRAKSEETTSTTIAKGSQHWLVSEEDIVANPGPTSSGYQAPPSQLNGTSPFVQETSSVLSNFVGDRLPLTLVGGSHLNSSQPQNAVSFGSSSGATLTVFVQQLNGPASPFLLDEQTFDANYTLGPDGTETLVINNDPSWRLAVVTITPDGRSIRLFAESADPTSAPIPFTLDELKQMEAALLAANLQAS
jgi:hypothetical protein